MAFHRTSLLFPFLPLSSSLCGSTLSSHCLDAGECQVSLVVTGMIFHICGWSLCRHSNSRGFDNANTLPQHFYLNSRCSGPDFQTLCGRLFMNLTSFKSNVAVEIQLFWKVFCINKTIALLAVDADDVFLIEDWQVYLCFTFGDFHYFCHYIYCFLVYIYLMI